eukprot:TRINITY_DN23134_c0_g1_i5.p1 TRINITY_DN23134_c0_g1~~TRINITY_DN23134_c0_g1_i5.p1  ORF type:complete len:404 (+),score=78.64 TRINITY_DN23134_c0_g1_i5:86-1297(+)
MDALDTPYNATQREIVRAMRGSVITIPGPGRERGPRMCDGHTVYTVVVSGPHGTQSTARLRYRDMRALAVRIKSYTAAADISIPGRRWFATRDPQLLRHRAGGFERVFNRALGGAGRLASQPALLEDLAAALGVEVVMRYAAAARRLEARQRGNARERIILGRYWLALRRFSEIAAGARRLRAADGLWAKNLRSALLGCYRRLLRRREERIAHRRHIAEQEEAEQLRRVEGALRLEAEGRQRLREGQQWQAAELRRQERAVVFAQGIAALSAEEAGRRNSVAGVQEWLEACKPSDEPPVPAKIYYPPTPPPPLRSRPTTPPSIGRFWRVVGWRGDCVTPDPEAPPPETAPEPSAPQLPSCGAAALSRPLRKGPCPFGRAAPPAGPAPRGRPAPPPLPGGMGSR